MANGAREVFTTTAPCSPRGNHEFHPPTLAVVFRHSRRLGQSTTVRQQQDVIEYLRAENQVLKEIVGKRRILLTDHQRKRLAAKGKILGRKLLLEVGTLFTPDTILRWHRILIARKFDYSERRKQYRLVDVDAWLRLRSSGRTAQAMVARVSGASQQLYMLIETIKF